MFQYLKKKERKKDTNKKQTLMSMQDANTQKLKLFSKIELSLWAGPPSCSRTVSLAGSSEVVQRRFAVVPNWLAETRVSAARRDSTWRNACGKASFIFRLAVAAFGIYETDFK